VWLPPAGAADGNPNACCGFIAVGRQGDFVAVSVAAHRTRILA